MKNVNQERLYRLMRQYHRHNQWRLRNGLYVPHCYEEPRKLSWWDDVGFILNRRRVMVWWVHPRMEYADAIEDMACKEAGIPPPPDFESRKPGKKLWKKVGRSRKKVIGYEASPTVEAKHDYYENLFAIENRMKSDGIDFEVRPSMTVKAFSWCTGIDLCAPIEVREEKDVVALARLAKQLLKGEMSLDAAFPGYRYGLKNWLDEADLRNGDK